MASTRLQSTVHAHHWKGFRYYSRLTRSPAARLDPVVLIGGAMQRKEDWGRLEQGMLEAADVICPDLPGWGEADLLAAEHGPDLLADALRHLLDDLGVRRANVFAGSYGTAIAYRLAQTAPDRIARMVLAGTMSTIPDEARPGMQGAIDLALSGVRERFGPAAVEMLMCADPGIDIASAAVVRRILSRRFEGVSEDELAKFVANTRRLLERDLIDTSLSPVVPALFAVGAHDTLTPPELCRELALTCRDSWFTVMPRADHLLHLERPRELVDLMTRFFATEPLAGLHRDGLNDGPYDGPYDGAVEYLNQSRVPALT
ncbi:alpha/beta fold hydrolase [Glycomyces buryatensis]|nr:alpha/beta hydrolase [Glycomyces buryatensis]